MAIRLTWNGRRLAAFSSANMAKGSEEPEDQKRRRLPWQDRAYAYYDSLGEIWYASQFFARTLGKIELVVQELKMPDADNRDSDDSGTQADTDKPTDPEWGPTKNPKALEALERVRGKNGQRNSLQAMYGRLDFLVGECNLIITWPGGKERWEVVSTSELRQLSEGEWERKLDGANAKKIYREVGEDLSTDPDEAGVPKIQVYRLWREHPQYSQLADGPLRGVLDQCEELLLLDRAVRGRTRSRIAGSGILLIPNEVSQPPATKDTGQAAKRDTFLRAIIDHMTASIANEGTSSSVVPLLVRGPAAALKEVRHLDLGIHEKSTPEIALRDKCVERIALGLDMPPEVLLGVTDANHWTAWQIDEASWEAHAEPAAIRMVNDFTSSFFRPSIEAEGLDPLVFRIWYDASAVINHPNRGADADTGYELGNLSAAAWRAAHGFDDIDAPTVEELMRRIAFRWGDLGLLETGNPEDSTGPLGRPPGLQPTQGGGTDSGEPVNTAPNDGNENAAILLDERIFAAAELMMMQARQKAGARLRTYLRKNKLDAPYSAVENIDLCSAHCTAGGTIDGKALVQGAGDEFMRTLIERLGIPSPIAQQVVESVEAWAASTLCSADPGRVPVSVASRIEVAAAMIDDPNA